EEVRKLMEGLMQDKEQHEDFGGIFTKEEWDEMDREGDQAEKGESTFHTIAEVMERLRNDPGK
ncbi:MAG: hypothetical protein ABIQ75_01570, partial [Flavobacteriales bacterium]